MSENSAIEWTDNTFNPWEGCTKVSPGCAHCYAETRNARWNGGTAPNWGKGKPRRRTSDSNWKQPLKWNRDVLLAKNQPCGCIVCTCEDEIQCQGCGASHCGKHPVGKIPSPKFIRPRVFCASLADWLDDEVPIKWQNDLLRLIESTPNLDWLMLSKRPENWDGVIINAIHADIDMARQWADGRPPHNVWIGTTAEDQQRADERIPLLLQIPAKVRFVSCEPLLEPVDLVRAHRTEEKLPNWPEPTRVDWVITGGESGSKCRHFSADWARSLRDQCAAAGVAFFMKQMGGTKKPFEPIPDDLMIREFPKGGEA